MQFEHWLIHSIYQYFLDLLPNDFVNRFMFHFEVKRIEYLKFLIALLRRSLHLKSQIFS